MEALCRLLACISPLSKSCLALVLSPIKSATCFSISLFTWLWPHTKSFFFFIKVLCKLVILACSCVNSTTWPKHQFSTWNAASNCASIPADWVLLLRGTFCPWEGLTCIWGTPVTMTDWGIKTMAIWGFGTVTDLPPWSLWLWHNQDLWSTYMACIDGYSSSSQHSKTRVDCRLSCLVLLRMGFVFTHWVWCGDRIAGQYEFEMMYITILLIVSPLLYCLLMSVITPLPSHLISYPSILLITVAGSLTFLFDGSSHCILYIYI